ncbi:PucR family transcriptional regulator [Nocardia sp. NPDC004750]
MVNADPAGIFVEWLADCGERVLLEMAGGLSRQLPDLAVDEDLPALRSSVTSHLDTMSTEIAHPRRRLRFPLPPEAQNFARLAAVRGTPLSTLLRSYEIGHAAVWKKFTAYLRENLPSLSLTQHADVLEVTSVRLFEYIQTATSESVAIYNQASSRRALGETIRKAELVRNALRNPGNEAEIEEVIGYRFASTHVGFVAATNDDARADTLEGSLEAMIRPKCWQRIYITAGPRTVYGWVSSKSAELHRRLADLAPPDWMTIAVGSPAFGADGFRSTHRQALEAHRVAERASAEGVTLFDDVAAAALASRDLDLAQDFVEHELGGLLGNDTRLITTLQVFMRQSGSASSAAHHLHVHPNTVRQRLQRIESILGKPVDPGNVNLRLAVELELSQVRTPAI